MCTRHLQTDQLSITLNEHLDHHLLFVYECFHTDQFLKDFNNLWFVCSRRHVEVPCRSLQNVLIGILDEVSLSRNITVFKEMIKIKLHSFVYKTEK